ncbi:hypothetical protein DPSP01_004972 [Paraphaeosphaeria sporulosa]|uniref:Cylicin I n=1 Tax=Paraphaeosphaeria sporulosa TaxID=1460663 RepID=A0A177C976_9PLEO|nr:uncharacterized protein CC84DRAFT_966185 [Paraphaeosphaeria sporulosa]OAG03307.1 hypothetical protein CC84DRAFT_966185 [Paraphaeosphaeria sporulosa]
MSFIRSTTLRASSIARSARYIRSSEVVQPLQRAVQRRTYASAHGHGQAKKSDLPWIVSSLAGTGAALYVVLNQDLSHGSHEEEEHALPDKLTTQPEEALNDKHDSDLSSVDPKRDNAAAGGATVDKEAKNASKGATEEELEGEKNSGRAADIKEDLAKQKGDESPHATADDKSSNSPDDNDTPHSRKPSGDSTDTSGKQEGLSNADTKHTSAIHDDPEKSKKGEGVAETAKLKGTVSTERPGAESDQRGKAKQDKDEKDEKDE